MDTELDEILGDYVGHHTLIYLKTGTRYYGKILRLEMAKDGGRKVVLQAPCSVNQRGEHLPLVIPGDRTFRTSQIVTWIFPEDPTGGAFEDAI